MPNIKKMSDGRLKKYKISLYTKLNQYRHKCECCNEWQVDDPESLNEVYMLIRDVSIEQMSRK